MRRSHPGGLAAALLLGLSVSLAPAPPGLAVSESSEEIGSKATAAAPSFVFGAGGDLGANRLTTEGLERLDASAAEFFLALGDLDYDQTESDEAWCTYVKKHLPTKGPHFPFELVSGNHEADGGPDGEVANMAACLQDRLNSTGEYGAQYSFTYPPDKPLAKVLMISPRLTVGGHTYDYRPGTADRKWLVGQIDAARDNGIPWVVVGMHYPCLSTGAGHSGCDAGTAVQNLLVRKRVDLLLTGHNHIYERSKQVGYGRGCDWVPKRRYDGDCVRDAGKDDAYRAGRGTVQVTSGRVGGRHQGVNPDDSHRRWFVTAGGRTTGWTRVKITETRLRSTYVNTSGAMRDSFTITR